MKYLRIALLLGMVIFLSSCGPGTGFLLFTLPDGIDDEVQITDLDVSMILSSPQFEGTLFLDPGEEYMIRVFYITRNTSGITYTDVTGTSSYNWEGSTSVANIDMGGRIIAQTPGTTKLAVKYNTEGYGASNFVYLSVIVR
jgi:hypothetical protein